MRSILIVEDDHDVRVMLRQVLELEGFTVLSAANGKDGFEIMRRQKPSLVLLDLMMPIMSGWDFLRLKKIDQDLASIPTVVISAHSAMPVPIPDAFLPKPIQLDALLPLAVQYCG